MKIILLTFTTFLFLLSCSSTRTAVTPVAKDRVETVEYKDFKGSRMENYMGAAIIRKYFKNNNLVSIKFFDVNDELIKNKKSWDKKNAEWKFEYDENNNFVKQTAYNYLGEICAVENWGNSAIEIFDYNDENQLVKKANYNKDMQLVGLGDIKDALTRYGYNEKGQLIWQKSFNANDKFLANGFCYGKFEYNKDGTLKKHTYLYDEDKVNTNTFYTYENGKLKKEESFNEAGEKVSYELYEYDENGDMIGTENWHYKWNKRNIKKRQITLDLKGWQMKEADKRSLKFKYFGDAEYTVIINSEGRIEHMEPYKYKGGTKEFEMELYSKFKNISLERTPGTDSTELEGKLKITILFQEIGRFYDIERTLNPDPNKNY